MSVTIPSDLVAGVLQAAAPQRVQAATLRLSGAVAPAPDFLAGLVAMAGPQTVPSALPGDMVMDVLNAADPVKSAAAERRIAGVAVAGTAKADAYQKFEAFLLSSAFDNILPKAESGAFGEGYAGSIWRSMAAEHFASIYAGRGGIGVAEMLRSRAETGTSVAAASGQWPYFRSEAITAFQS